jgi:hypothetical protein
LQSGLKIKRKIGEYMKQNSNVSLSKKSLLAMLSLTFVLVACGDQIPPTSISTSSNSSTTQTSSLDGYNTWVNSNQAIDINDDGRINRDDYTLWLEYLVWRDSDAAEDFNNDRKINTVDFMIFKQYGTWRTSDDAIDLNDDDRINILDFIIWLDYLKWKDSDDAADLNNDTKINELDYGIFLNRSEFEGTYRIRNYSYAGPNLQFIQSGVKFAELGDVIDSITLSVDISGAVSAELDPELRTTLGSDFGVIETVFDNMVIQRISPLLIAIDTVVIVGGTSLNLTFNLTQITGGYRTTINLVFDSQTITVSFELIRN